jgi:dGTPase
MLEDLFEHYLKHVEEIGESARKRARKIGRARAVCDYIAGMTDRYVSLEHRRVFGARDA